MRVEWIKFFKNHKDTESQNRMMLTSMNDDSPSGCYCVNDESYVILKRFDTQEFLEKNYSVDNIEIDNMFKFMYTLPPLPNPRRPTTFLKRPQVTFSPINYDFGQKTTTLPYNEHVPGLIKTCKSIVENIVSEYGFDKLFEQNCAGALRQKQRRPHIDAAPARCLIPTRAFCNS